MEQRRCSSCGRQLSDAETVCPDCNHLPVHAQRRRWSLFLVLLLVACLASAALILQQMIEPFSGFVTFGRLPVAAPAVRAEISGEDLPGLPDMYREGVAHMLNLLARGNSACGMGLVDRVKNGAGLPEKDVVVVMDAQYPSADNPGFFLECGTARKPVPVSFTWHDALHQILPTTAQPIDRDLAIAACKTVMQGWMETQYQTELGLVFSSRYQAEALGAAANVALNFVMPTRFPDVKYLRMTCFFDGDVFSGHDIIRSGRFSMLLL